LAGIFNKKVQTAALIDTNLIFYPPQLNNTSPPPSPHWDTLFSIWGEITGIADGILGGLEAFLEFLLHLLTPGCTLFNIPVPNLICQIINFIKWIIIIFVIIAIIWISYKVYTFYQSAHQSSQISHLLAAQEEILSKGTTAYGGLRMEEETYEHQRLLPASTLPIVATPYVASATSHEASPLLSRPTMFNRRQ
jgi:hypothetical protein